MLTSLDQAKKLWQAESPVIFQDPHTEKPIRCKIRAIKWVRENGKEFTELELKVPPNCIIVTIPRWVSEAPAEPNKQSPELERALAELREVRDKGEFDDE